jgi:NADH-quinone oxidoreductase subunit C
VPPAAPITELEQLKEHASLATLLAWRPEAVRSAKLDRGDLAIAVERESLREACARLRNQLGYSFLSTITCVDWYPARPRFEVVYQLLAMKAKQRVRLKVWLTDDDAVADSVVEVWPAANFFEREVFDLFGIRFAGHPYLRRILMPDDWQGHPLRKDYPVEGYR